MYAYIAYIYKIFLRNVLCLWKSNLPTFFNFSVVQKPKRNDTRVSKKKSPLTSDLRLNVFVLWPKIDNNPSSVLRFNLSLQYET